MARSPPPSVGALAPPQATLDTSQPAPDILTPQEPAVLTPGAGDALSGGTGGTGGTGWSDDMQHVSATVKRVAQPEAVTGYRRVGDRRVLADVSTADIAAEARAALRAKLNAAEAPRGYRPRPGVPRPGSPASSIRDGLSGCPACASAKAERVTVAQELRLTPLTDEASLAAYERKLGARVQRRQRPRTLQPDGASPGGVDLLLSGSLSADGDASEAPLGAASVLEQFFGGSSVGDRAAVLLSAAALPSLRGRLRMATHFRRPRSQGASAVSAVCPQGAVVRLQADLTSAVVAQLPAGAAVSVAEIQGRRARITRPVDGWISICERPPGIDRAQEEPAAPRTASPAPPPPATREESAEQTHHDRVAAGLQPHPGIAYRRRGGTWLRLRRLQEAGQAVPGPGRRRKGKPIGGPVSLRPSSALQRMLESSRASGRKRRQRGKGPADPASAAGGGAPGSGVVGAVGHGPPVSSAERQSELLAALNIPADLSPVSSAAARGPALSASSASSSPAGERASERASEDSGPERAKRQRPQSAPARRRQRPSDVAFDRRRQRERRKADLFAQPRRLHPLSTDAWPVEVWLGLPTEDVAAAEQLLAESLSGVGATWPRSVLGSDLHRKVTGELGELFAEEAEKRWRREPAIPRSRRRRWRRGCGGRS
eukprot:TRINITY_DN2489_c1_g1_i1.p1 TRINITY_DN2489_c1_g1~~TRINITY_DN2489_c1_g1_i1.p1  ORF type:complete len:681 (+),score=216.29 TRINITY_DN2489_c1_g1_i1:72-2045(+)